jgi:diphthine synthase
MLILIGLGLSGIRGLSVEALEVLESVDRVYVEAYTSPFEFNLDEFKSLTRKDASIVKRWFVEDGRVILNESKSMDVALLCYGDPLVATTHTELIVRAKRDGIGVKIIHNTSAVTSILGSMGLHIYKLGRVITLVKSANLNLSVYYTLFNNLLLGNHTLLLLEYDSESGYFLNPPDAFEILLRYEDAESIGVVNRDTFAVVASRIGMSDESIVAGNISSLLRYEFGRPPHAIVITGRMHFTEIEALKALALMIDEPKDNSDGIKTKYESMLARYIPRARSAVVKAFSAVDDLDDASIKSRLKDVLSNAEYYLDDAEMHARQGRYEHAILALGYSEGLIDSIRYIIDTDPWSKGTD